MNVKKTYRFISALLSLTLFSGVITPVLGHSGLMQHCSTSMSHESEKMDSHHNDMEMYHSMDMDSNNCSDMSMNHGPTEEPNPSNGACEMEISCICDFTHSAVQKDALLVTKHKAPILFVTEVISELNADLNYSPPLTKKFLEAYSPPLLFLANESFLI